jgi:hypothetical protein
VILAEPHSAFLSRWLDEYRRFEGGPPGTRLWNEYSVLLPSKLAREHPTEITVLPHTAFFWPLWTDDHLAWIFESNRPIPLDRTYANHLWENFAWNYLEDLTPRHVRSTDTNFNVWARPLIDGLADDFGAPSLRKRLQNYRRRALQKVRALKSRTKRRLAAARYPADRQL